ncbi:hypothetical protein ABI_00350 [Asticcacaulis biprosthecium C19]|uniref:Uncharacterized protein n=1 Tax=Asticcacaulis biprosthecium C19 TaxID=715226 RepID=F4QFZ2_9CAUL|nr:hypothetical protein ABI_00350 [Asticcacaulis biprosthecium C19]
MQNGFGINQLYGQYENRIGANPNAIHLRRQCDVRIIVAASKSFG